MLWGQLRQKMLVGPPFWRWNAACFDGFFMVEGRHFWWSLIVLDGLLPIFGFFFLWWNHELHRWGSATVQLVRQVMFNDMEWPTATMDHCSWSDVGDRPSAMGSYHSFGRWWKTWAVLVRVDRPMLEMCWLTIFRIRFSATFTSWASRVSSEPTGKTSLAATRRAIGLRNQES